MKFISSLIARLTPFSLSAANPGWDDLVRTSNEYMNTQRVSLEADYQISSYERWDIDQEKGELVFSDAGTPKVVATIQFIGSFSATSNTWLWSWGNESILPNLSERLSTVRAYGQKHRFAKLIDAKWKSTENDGWEMASVANYLLKAKGIYRPPFNQGNTFIIMTEIRKVSSQ